MWQGLANTPRVFSPMLQSESMMIFEVLQSALIALLTGYLSITNGIAAHIEETFFSLTHEESSITEISSPPKAAPSTELTLLSKLYASAGNISEVLSTNDSFRNAAQIIGSISPVTVPQSEETTRARIEDSLVNVFCEYKTDRYTRTTTGSGFFITETGVILTNAHVAQFLLLESLPDAPGETKCIIRTGNPATPNYRAELLFISPSWIFNNAKLIASEHPQGTGEYDYALLYVTESLTEDPLPTSFAALPLYTELLSRKYEGMTILTAGYPAEKLLRDGPRASLSSKVAETSIEELYTFGSNYADIVTISESAVGEQGASGGPIYQNGIGVIGLITTKGSPDEDGTKSLRALTISYINRTIQKETGFTLVENAHGDLSYRGKVFKEVLEPHLRNLLAFELE